MLVNKIEAMCLYEWSRCVRELKTTEESRTRVQFHFHAVASKWKSRI
jgi:hypothetical protein